MSIQEMYLKDIADAIREKEGSSETIQASTFADRIRALSAAEEEPELTWGGAIPNVIIFDQVKSLIRAAYNDMNGIFNEAGIYIDVSNITVTGFENDTGYLVQGITLEPVWVSLEEHLEELMGHAPYLVARLAQLGLYNIYIGTMITYDGASLEAGPIEPILLEPRNANLNGNGTEALSEFVKKFYKDQPAELIDDYLAFNWRYNYYPKTASNHITGIRTVTKIGENKWCIFDIDVKSPIKNRKLEDISWYNISSISQAGLGESYWDIGDTKSIKLSGTVGSLEINETLYCYIIGFNHNSDLEGHGIHFGTFKTAQSDGIDVTLVDENYNTYKTDGTKTFNINHYGGTPYNTSYGGWKGSDIRYDILGSTNRPPSDYGGGHTESCVGYDPDNYNIGKAPVSNTLLAAFPLFLRENMKPITKYTDNRGGGGGEKDAVTASIDYLPLLSEYEVFGECSHSNQYEKDYQMQYQYFLAGNSTGKYRYDNPGTFANWWLRSPKEGYVANFCVVYGSGATYNYATRNSFGISPIFMV